MEDEQLQPGPGEQKDLPDDLVFGDEPRWLVLGSLLALLVGGWLARSWLGIEWNPASVRELVASWGLWGPVLFILLLAFRFLILIPSILLLTAGGLCFGAVGGTIFGAGGLLLAALVKYTIVRFIGAEAIRARIPRPYHGVLELTRSKAGAGAVALLSAYPAGPIAVLHVGAAIAGMALLTFVLAVGAGSLVRSALFSIFGSRLVEGDGLFLAGALLAVALLLPLAFPRTRAWLRQSLSRPERERKG